MVMELNVALVTVTASVLLTAPSVAVTVADPVLTPFNTPLVLTEATAAFEEAQVALEVTFAVLPSL
jgi:hypothetical protein